MVLVLAIWYASWSAVLLPLYPNPFPRLATALLMETGPIAALVLLRLGYFRQASLTYLVFTWMSATLRMALNGGIHSTAQLHYVTLPILAAWLLGYRAALWIAAISSSSALVFALLQVAGVNLAHIVPVTPMAAWAVLIQVTLIGAVPVAHFLRSLQDALAQSRRTEAELQEYKQHLEVLVEERTMELVEARDQAQAANRAKTSFLANMSHELRTPLNAILGFSALVRNEPNLSEEQRSELEMVEKSGQHLLALIDDALDMAKIEANRVVIESVPIDLYVLVGDVLNMVRESAQDKGLHLLSEVPAHTPRFIRSDPGKIRQVLTNLVGNAVKYTDRGTVAIEIDATVRQNSPEFLLRFDIKDTGIGIAPEEQARIFEPFFQAATARYRKGVGLGLSISRRLVEAMGGSIQVESTLGQGSRFYVELPAQTAAASELTGPVEFEQAITLEAGQSAYKVLIVEDERENRLLLKKLLESAGFHVQVAEDGAWAVKIFERWRPHFIWMDIRLPVLDGLQATRRIRESEGGRDVRIVAVTASASASQREEVLAAGFDDFLRKPYRTDEIFGLMSKILGVDYGQRARPQTGVETSPRALCAGDFASLPIVLSQELEEAVISLDPNRIDLVVERISAHDTVLALALRRLTDAYAYTHIFEAVRKCNHQARSAEVS